MQFSLMIQVLTRESRSWGNYIEWRNEEKIRGKERWTTHPIIQTTAPTTDKSNATSAKGSPSKKPNGLQSPILSETSLFWFFGGFVEDKWPFQRKSYIIQWCAAADAEHNCRVDFNVDRSALVKILMRLSLVSRSCWVFLEVGFSEASPTFSSLATNQNPDTCQHFPDVFLLLFRCQTWNILSLRWELKVGQGNATCIFFFWPSNIIIIIIIIFNVIF